MNRTITITEAEDTRTTLCPPADLIGDYHKALEAGLNIEEMTADNCWVGFHVKECEDCACTLSHWDD